MKRMIRFLSEFGVFVLLCITVISSAWAGAGEMVILAFGDSITYGMGSSSDGPQTGYPILLEKKLSALFPENFTVINVGVPGEATLWGSERFSSVINTYQPDLILLMEGTNDCVFNTPFLDIENNLRSMIQIARDQGIPVVIATIPPVITNAYADRTQQMDNIMAFNPRIYAIAADYNIRVAQVFEAITSVPGWQSALMDQASANHPNDAGYLLVRDAFYNQVAYLMNNGSVEASSLIRPYKFNAGLQNDLLWQNSQTGEFLIWLMNGTSIASLGSPATISDPNWKIRAMADFTGSGKTDILWEYGPTGSYFIWQMNGTSIGSAGYTATVSDPNWKIKAVADFNGDGKADVLWEYVPTGTFYIWQMNGTSIGSAGYTATVSDPNWKIKAVADFNGDGKADILWQYGSTGPLYVWQMNNTSIGSVGYLGSISDPNWKIKEICDFNGDGKADLLWQNTQTGELAVWLMNGTSLLATGSPGMMSDLNWKIKILADFDGDNKTDILWEHSTTGEIRIWLMNGTAIASQATLGYDSTLNWRLK